MIEEKIDLDELVTYVERISGFKLIPEQIDTLKNLADFSIKKMIVCCGRAYSKSFLCAAFALYLADKYSTRIGRPLTILLISHQEEIYVKMDMFFYRCSELVERLRVKGDKFSMPREGFQFKDNMSKVLLRLDTSHQIRGNDASITIIDEAQSVEEEIVFRDAMPTSRKDMAKFVLVGTPETGTYFTEKLKNAKKKKSLDAKEWVVSNYPSTVCPWLTEEGNNKIEQWRHELSREDFTTEILAEVPDPQYNPPWSKRKLSKRFIEEPATPLRRPNYYSMCGLDLGEKRNPCALVGIERSRSKLDLKVVFLKTYAPDSWMEIANQIKNDRYKFCMVDIRPKELSDKIKMFVEPICKETNFYYVNSSGIKDNMIAQMVNLVNDGHITIPKPYGEPLFKEMYRYYRGKESGCNLTDALTLACYQSPDYPLILTEEEGSKHIYGADGYGHKLFSTMPDRPQFEDVTIKTIKENGILSWYCPKCNGKNIYDVNKIVDNKLWCECKKTYIIIESEEDKKNVRGRSHYRHTIEEEEKMNAEFEQWKRRS